MLTLPRCNRAAPRLDAESVRSGRSEPPAESRPFLSCGPFDRGCELGGERNGTLRSLSHVARVAQAVGQIKESRPRESPGVADQRLEKGARSRVVRILGYAARCHLLRATEITFALRDPGQVVEGDCL